MYNNIKDSDVCQSKCLGEIGKSPDKFFEKKIGVEIEFPV
jgi:hypothetical protein